MRASGQNEFLGGSGEEVLDQNSFVSQSEVPA